ncbi:MAG: MFS transporter [Chloroflexi bacterium]|nr:MFS transporter [Chloroflexota bacterium]MBI3930941.1 MFS transporter [Chloroflexota bacterium]
MTTIKNYSPSLRKPKVFYGYWIIAATFLGAFMDSAAGYYAFSLFVKPLETAFGWSRGEIMLGWTARFLSVGLFSPFIGRLVDRYGARKIMAVGASIAGFGFIFLSQMSNLWHFYIGWIVLGFSMAATGLIPASAVVSNWFTKRRGIALGVMGIGFGAGGILSPLIGGYLIPTFGWSASYVALAPLMWILLPVALLVIKTRPADMGLYPDGMAAPETAAEDKAKTLLLTSKEATLKMAFATPTFWLIAVSFLLGSFGESSVTQSQVPHLQDIGFPIARAASTLAIVGIWSSIGKFIFGWFCDWMPPKYARAIGLGSLLTATTMLINVRPTSHPALLWGYATIQGFGIGSWLPAMSMLISTTFGLTSYGAIVGMLALAQSIGVGTGPLLAARLYDTTGSYYGAFNITLALLVLAITAIVATRRPKLV